MAAHLATVIAALLAGKTIRAGVFLEGLRTVRQINFAWQVFY
jgi:hypothetical protein